MHKQPPTLQNRTIGSIYTPIAKRDKKKVFFFTYYPLLSLLTTIQNHITESPRTTRGE